MHSTHIRVFLVGASFFTVNRANMSYVAIYGQATKVRALYLACRGHSVNGRGAIVHIVTLKPL